MTHSPVPMTSVRYFATLRILFYALLAGQLIFLVITFVLRSTGSFGAMPELEKIFVYLYMKNHFSSQGCYEVTILIYL